MQIDMNHWTRINAERMRAEKERWQEVDFQRNLRHMRRLRRGSVVMSVLLSCVLVIGVVGFGGYKWSERRIQERLQAAKLEEVERLRIHEEKLARQRQKDQEKEAINALYGAYYDDEKASLEADNSEHAENTAAIDEASLAAFESALEDVEMAEDQLLGALQMKEEADKILVKAINQKIEFFQQIGAAERDRENSVHAAVPHRLMDSVVGEVPATVGSEETLIDREGVLTAEAREGDLGHQAKDELQKRELDGGDRERTGRDEQSATETSATAVLAVNRSVVQASEVHDVLDQFQQRISSAVTTKTAIEQELRMEYENKLEIDRLAIEQLERLGHSGSALKLAQRNRQFYVRASTLLRELHRFEGRFWLRMAKQRLAERKFFESKLLAAHAIGYHGFGRPGTSREDPFQVHCPVYLEQATPEYQETTTLLQEEPDYHLIWQVPGDLPMERPVSIAFTPDGHFFIWTENERIQVKDLSFRNEGFVLTADSVITSVTVNKGGFVMATSSAAAGIDIWDLRKRKVVSRLRDRANGAVDLEFSLDGSMLAATGLDNTVRVWDLSNEPQLYLSLDGHTAPVESLSFSPDGMLLASAGTDDSILLWDLKRGVEYLSLPGHGPGVNFVCFSPDGQTLVSGGADGVLDLWDVNSGEKRSSMSNGTTPVTSICFSPDGIVLATGHSAGVRLWNLVERAIVAEVSGHSAAVGRLEFSSDGRTLAASDGELVKLWNIAPVEKSPRMKREAEVKVGIASKQVLESHAEGVISVSVSPDNNLLFSGSRDHSVKIWDLESGTVKATLEGHTGAIVDTCADSNGTVLASASLDSTIKLWNLESYREKKTLTIHGDRVYCIAASPDGSTMASGGKDRSVAVWDMNTGVVRQVFDCHDHTVISICFDPTGTTLASGDMDGRIMLWNPECGEEIGSLIGHSDAVFDVRFSPDGKVLASTGKDKHIILWNIETKSVKSYLTGHQGTVYSLGFSPDGRLLATASRDRTVKIWDTSRAEEIATLTNDDAVAFSVAFGPHGKSLLCGSGDNNIKLWNIETIGTLDFFQYASLADIKNFDISWLPPSPNTPLMNVTCNSHIGVVRSGDAGKSAQLEMFWHYYRSGSVLEALNLLVNLSEGQKKTILPMVDDEVKRLIGTAIETGSARQAHALLGVSELLGTFQTSDPKTHYVQARLAYLECREGLEASRMERTNLLTQAINHVCQALENDPEISTVDLVDRIGADLAREVPDLEQRLARCKAIEWLKHAQTRRRTYPQSILESVDFALREDEQFVRKYLLENGDSWLLFNLACAYGLRARTGMQSEGSGGTAPDQDISKAIEQLVLAVKNGWSDWERLENDSALKVLHSDSRFHDLLSRRLE